MQLYKYNGNLLHPSMFSLWRLSPAVEMSAGGKFLSACGSGKSAGGKPLRRRIDDGVEGQKEKVCYTIDTMDTFHSALVTSKPTLLQIILYLTRSHISVLSVRPADKTRVILSKRDCVETT